MSFSCTHAQNQDSSYTSYSTIIAKIKVDTEFSSDNYLNKLFTSFTVGTDPDCTVGPRNLKLLISSYCSSVLMNGHVIKDGFVYSPRQSAFVYLLCKNINPVYSLFFVVNAPQFTGYFKESAFDKLDLPVKNDERHLVYLYADDLFNTIIKEYFAIKQADVYGLQTHDEKKFSLKKQIINFTSSHFGWIELCNKSDELSKTFSKTCTYMTQYLRNQKKMFKDLNILSASGMYNDYTPATATACSDAGKVDSSYNIMLCGLWWEPKEKTLSPFINLVYNELFYYNLFVEYYSLQIAKKPNLFKDTTMNNGVWTISDQQASRINEMKTELLFAKQALRISVRMLRNAYVTFSLHIWFLMYRESLQDFGEAMAKIATPVYTLFAEKGNFRNVQCLPQ